jgi:hypothetical protein
MTAVASPGKRAAALGLAEGVRVWMNWALPGQPPLAVWVISRLEPDDLHLHTHREGNPATSLRLPLVATRPVPHRPVTPIPADQSPTGSPARITDKENPA